MGKRARGRSMIGSVSPTSSRWRYVVVPSLSAPPLSPSMSPIACYHCHFPGWRAPPAVTSTLCSSCYASQDPGVRGADDPKTKFNQKRYIHKGDVQQRTSFPATQDLQATGLHLGGAAHKDKMTMLDHDRGVVWPPPEGHEWMHAKFMGMVSEPSPYKDEVKGVRPGVRPGVRAAGPRSRGPTGP